jgi:hypothetical protein
MASGVGVAYDFDSPISPSTMNLNILIGHGCVLDGNNFILPRNTIIYTFNDPGDGICMSDDRLLVELRRIIDSKPNGPERIREFERVISIMSEGKAKKHIGSPTYLMNEHIIDFNDDSSSVFGHGKLCCFNFFSTKTSTDLLRENIKKDKDSLKNSIQISANKYLLSELIKKNGQGYYLLWFCRNNCLSSSTPLLARTLSADHAPISYENKHQIFYQKYLKYKRKYLELRSKINQF